MAFTNYHSRYGYPRWIAYTAEVWWRLEHLPYRGGLCGPVARYAYRQRKTWERRGNGDRLG
jgi:hypothetical protein